MDVGAVRDRKIAGNDRASRLSGDRGRSRHGKNRLRLSGDEEAGARDVGGGREVDRSPWAAVGADAEPGRRRIKRRRQSARLCVRGPLPIRAKGQGRQRRELFSARASRGAVGGRSHRDVPGRGPAWRELCETLLPTLTCVRHLDETDRWLRPGGASARAGGALVSAEVERGGCRDRDPVGIVPRRVRGRDSPGHLRPVSRSIALRGPAHPRAVERGSVLDTAGRARPWHRLRERHELSGTGSGYRLSGRRQRNRDPACLRPDQICQQGRAACGQPFSDDPGRSRSAGANLPHGSLARGDTDYAAGCLIGLSRNVWFPQWVRRHGIKDTVEKLELGCWVLWYTLGYARG